MKVLFAILVELACLVSAHGATPADERKLQRLPAAVRLTVMQHLGDGTLGRIAKTPDDAGQLNYAVVVKKDGKVRGLTIASDGRLLEMEVFFEETPAAAQKTIRLTGKGIKPDNISQVIDEAGATNFEVEITDGGRTRDFTVKWDGALASIQVFLSELPAPVQKTIRETLDGGTLGDITRTFEDGESYYDVEMKKDGQERDFSVGPDGELQSMQCALSETPTAVQKTIQAEAKDGRIESVEKRFDDGEAVFAARVNEGGKTREFNVSPEGKLVPAEQ